MMILSSLYPYISCAFRAHCPVHKNHQKNGLVLAIDALFCAKSFIVYIVDYLLVGQVKSPYLATDKERNCFVRGIYAHIYEAFHLRLHCDKRRDSLRAAILKFIFSYFRYII